MVSEAPMLSALLEPLSAGTQAGPSGLGVTQGTQSSGGQPSGGVATQVQPGSSQPAIGQDTSLLGVLQPSAVSAAGAAANIVTGKKL